MTENTRKVIGIDPASGKGSYVFAPDVPDPSPSKAHGTGIDRVMTPSELREVLPASRDQKGIASKPFGVDSCLVCWDAPLTGLQDPDALVVEATSENDDTESLTTRPIERKGEKAPKEYRKVAHAAAQPGVSLLGFSGLSHWVISRNVLGLPRVGRFDAEYDELPLYPVFTKDELTHHEWAVTEVHPTLAAWMWLSGSSNWQPYKGAGVSAEQTRTVTKKLWVELLAMHPVKGVGANFENWSDDAFDARVAWLLGHLWLHRNSVQIIGNERDGSFLIPTSDSTSN